MPYFWAVRLEYKPTVLFSSAIWGRKKLVDAGVAMVGKSPAAEPKLTGKPNPVDIHVGNRVRLRRTLLGMSQEKLGDAIGLTFQQVQKYERGTNRIGASRLYVLSRVLDVPVSFFFDDMAPEAAGARAPASGMQDAGAIALEPDPLAKRETLELVRNYYKISNAKVRRRLFELTKSLGNDGRD